MVLNIDVTHSFTDDCGYWDTYGKKRKGNSTRDPDTCSVILRMYQQQLYSRETSNGLRLVLDDHLVWNNMHFSSDAIINMYAYQLPEVEKEIDDYEETIKKYIHKSYTIGGEIIFPKHDFKKYGQTINQRRGWHPRIKDRFDLTLECIRRFYEGKDSPLFKTLKIDEAFFNLFGKGKNGFKNYVDFFFLNDLVLPNGKINFFLDTKTDIFSCNDPRPQNKQEWQQLYDNQMKFLENRNKKINDFILKG